MQADKTKVRVGKNHPHIIQLVNIAMLLSLVESVKLGEWVNQF